MSRRRSPPPTLPQSADRLEPESPSVDRSRALGAGEERPDAVALATRDGDVVESPRVGGRRTGRRRCGRRDGPPRIRPAPRRHSAPDRGRGRRPGPQTGGRGGALARDRRLNPPRLRVVSRSRDLVRDERVRLAVSHGREPSQQHPLRGALRSVPGGAHPGRLVVRRRVRGFDGLAGDGIVRFILRGDTVDAYVYLMPGTD